MCSSDLVYLSLPLNIEYQVFTFNFKISHSRFVDDRKVWYEWSLSSPICTPIQNSGGTSSWIGL